MENYSSTLFLLAFSRFSGETGYPKVLLVDGRCQLLLKACENMSLDFDDIKHKLNESVKVHSEICPVGAQETWKEDLGNKEINGKVIQLWTIVNDAMGNSGTRN